MHFSHHKRLDDPPPQEMSINDTNLNTCSQGTRETGFPEPLSRERNTTLPHEDAAPNEVLDTSAITENHRPHIPGHHHNKRRQEEHAEKAQAEMYSGLEVHDNPDEKPKDGAIKKVLNKLSCGTV